MRIYWRRRPILLLLLLLLAVILGSVAVHAAGRLVYTSSLDSRPLNIGIMAPINSLNPAEISSHEERLVGSLLYEGLVHYDEGTQRVKPMLTDSFRYEENGQKIVFKLKDARFSNGKKLEALDVKTCWEKTLAVNGDYRSLCLPIAGSQEFLQGEQSEIWGLQATNSRTLEITLTAPNAAFIYMLTQPAFWVYDSNDASVSVPGTGPFIIQQATEQRLSLLYNQAYHRGSSPLKAVEIKAFLDPAQALAEFKGGHLDYVDKVNPSVLPAVRNDSELGKRLLEKPLCTIYSIGFNLNKKPFSENYLLRRAINYAIDREAINKNVLGEAYRPVKGVLPPELPGYNQEISGYAYNPEKAAQLLEQAGYPGGQGLGVLVLAYNQGDGHQRVAEAIASQLSMVGIPVQLSPLSWDNYKRQLDNYNLALFRLEWSADYPDADGILYSLFHSSNIGSSNYFAYHNNQVDRVLDDSRAVIDDTTERIKLLQKAEQMIIDDAPCLWLFQTAASKLIGDNVRNLAVDCLDSVDWFKVELKKPVIDTVKSAAEGKV